MKFDNFDYEIIRLALIGKKDDEIARIMGVEKHYITSRILLLREENPSIYNKIYFERHVFDYLVDKDVLFKVMDLVFQGFLYFEIGLIIGKSEKEVKELLEAYNKKSSPYYNPGLFKALKEKMKKNEADEKAVFQRLKKLVNQGTDLSAVTNHILVRRFQKYYRNKKIIEDILDSGCTITDEALAFQNGVSVGYVRDLILGQDDYNMGETIFGKETMEYIKKKRMIRNQEKKKVYNQNNAPHHNPYPKKDKETLNSSQENFRFWIHILFTFRLSLMEFSIVLGISDLELLSKYLYSNYSESSLNYLFSNSDLVSQAKISSVRTYLKQLEEAKNKNDMKRYYELLKQISDVEYKKILQKRKENPRYVLSDEEIRVIILYRLKYGLPFHSLPFSSEMLTRRCPSDLKEQFEKLGVENGENFRYVSHRRSRCRNMEETDS